MLSLRKIMASSRICRQTGLYNYVGPATVKAYATSLSLNSSESKPVSIRKSRWLLEITYTYLLKRSCSISREVHASTSARGASNFRRVSSALAGIANSFSRRIRRLIGVLARASSILWLSSRTGCHGSARGSTRGKRPASVSTACFRFHAWKNGVAEFCR